MVPDLNNSGRREQPARAVVFVLDQQVVLFDHPTTSKLAIFLFRQRDYINNNNMLLNVVHGVTTLNNKASQPLELPGFICLFVSSMLGWLI